MTRERYPVLVSLSILLGRLSLVVGRASGLPASASPAEAKTPMQRLAFWLGARAGRLNDIGFGRGSKVERLGLPA